MEKLRELKSERFIINGCVETWINELHDFEKGFSISHSTYFLVDKSDLNKKLFLVFEGVLRQFKIKKQIFSPFNYTYKFDNKAVNSAILIDIAGIGEVWVIGYHGCYQHGMLPFDCFLSVDDYKNNEPYNISYLEYKAGDVANFLTKKGVCSFTHSYCTYYSHIYYWDGVKSIMTTRKYDIALCFTWDGEKVDTKTPKITKPFYATEEECTNDNSIKVECFADKDEEEEKAENDNETIVEVSVKVTKGNVERLLEFVEWEL